MARTAATSRVVAAVTGLALAAYAIAAVGSGLDRIAATRPSMARLVPEPFSARAKISAAGAAFDRRDYALALHLAKEGVVKEPVDNHALGNLGAALAMSGDGRGAERAFTVAAATGWRDLPTQVYWYQRAMQAGDLRVASQRLDAILRVNPQWPLAGSPMMTGPWRVTT